MQPEVKPPPDIDLSGAAGVVRDQFCRTLTVGNNRGVHARPATLLMKLSKALLEPANGESVEFTVDNYSANPTNGILSMLMLVGGKGSSLLVTVRGVDLERATRFLDAVQSVITHPCVEEEIHLPNAAQTLGLSPELVTILRGSISDMKPNK